MIENQPGTRKIFGLDLMRVVAILLVLAAHSLWIYPNYSNLLTKGMNFSGFIGVEIFFVLSGFLIGGSLHRTFMKNTYGFRAMRHFLKRRAYRIMPNYLLILFCNLSVAAIIGYNVVDPWKYFVFVQNFASPMLPFFPESWSMAIKEIPYFIVPIVLLAMTSFGGSRNRNRLFLITTIILILLPFVAKVMFHFNNQGLTLKQWNISLRSVAIYRIDAVMTGVLFSWLMTNYGQAWRKYSRPMFFVSLFIMFVLVILVGFIKISIVDYPFFWNVMFLPLISLSAALSLPFFSQWKSAPAFLEKPVHFLGAISYFVYLIHYSLILWLMKYLIDTQSFSLLQLHCFTGVYLIVTFGLSWLLYNIYEKPILKYREQNI
jgi:peptidoglycan/LPS O-acetylase OafA/YrhL